MVDGEVFFFEFFAKMIYIYEYIYTQGAIHKLRHPLHGLMFKTSLFFSSESS